MMVTHARPLPVRSGWTWPHCHQGKDDRWPARVIPDIPSDLRHSMVGRDTRFDPEHVNKITRMASIVSSNARLVLERLPSAGANPQEALILFWSGRCSHILPMSYLRRTGDLFFLSRFFLPDILLGKEANLSVYLDSNEVALVLASEANACERIGQDAPLFTRSGESWSQHALKPVGFGRDVLQAVNEVTPNFGVQYAPRTMVSHAGSAAVMVFCKTHTTTIMPQMHIDRVRKGYRVVVWYLPDVIEVGSPKVEIFGDKMRAIERVQQTIRNISYDMDLFEYTSRTSSIIQDTTQ